MKKNSISVAGKVILFLLFLPFTLIGNVAVNSGIIIVIITSLALGQISEIESIINEIERLDIEQEPSCSRTSTTD